ncbi:hypothetical protein [Mycolicibacterium sp.]|uniref:hypothetical protein n=1 Tax=Mycolicibacterium sp. TaxID=2320850 RepID=UPI00093B5E80|nr:hypothetical protein EB73_07715 [Mycobacterium sp. SWH-M3]
MADDSQLETLTDQMKGWQSASDADLKVTKAGRDAYLGAIGELRTKLKEAQQKIGTLKTLGNPGDLEPAQLVKDGLQGDAVTLDTTITEYLAYLDAYEQTVKDAYDRMIQSG